MLTVGWCMSFLCTGLLLRTFGCRVCSQTIHSTLHSSLENHCPHTCLWYTTESMVARILDVMNIVPLQRQLKISEDFENYVECRRSKQIKGRFGNAEELVVPYSYASLPCLVSISVLSLFNQFCFSLADSREYQWKWKCIPSGLIYDCEAVSLSLCSINFSSHKNYHLKCRL